MRVGHRRDLQRPAIKLGQQYPAIWLRNDALQPRIRIAEPIERLEIQIKRIIGQEPGDAFTPNSVI